MEKVLKFYNGFQKTIFHNLLGITVSMNRRKAIQKIAVSGLAFSVFPCAGSAKTAQSFFRIKKTGDRWWLVDPQGRLFWSIGVNHVDPAGLRNPDSKGIWHRKFDNSMQKWLPEVRKDLLEWNFNTLGWNQEVVTINDQNHKHSRSFTFEEYQWLDMPYCHMLPFIESHQWEIETRLPDVRSKGFAEWAEYVARTHCDRLKDDPNLIGYFYVDCPVWIHNRPGTEWKGTLIDPELLKSDSGRKEARDIASTYYKVLHDAIRKFDRNHLILGDRYEARHPIAHEVIDAAAPYIDVYSFQCFGGSDTVKEKLGYWANYTKRPVLLADSAVIQKPYTKGWPAPNTRHQDTDAYREIHEVLKAIPECVGFHLCGAYIENNVRHVGLKTQLDEKDMNTDQIAAQNRAMQQWVDSMRK